MKQKYNNNSSNKLIYEYIFKNINFGINLKYISERFLNNYI